MTSGAAWGSVARRFRPASPKLVGQSMHPLSDRAADGGGGVSARNQATRGLQRIAEARAATRRSAAFSKLFHQHHGLSPGRYRAIYGVYGSPAQRDLTEAGVED